MRTNLEHATMRRNAFERDSMPRAQVDRHAVAARPPLFQTRLAAEGRGGRRPTGRRKRRGRRVGSTGLCSEVDPPPRQSALCRFSQPHRPWPSSKGVLETCDGGIQASSAGRGTRKAKEALGDYAVRSLHRCAPLTHDRRTDPANAWNAPTVRSTGPEQEGRERNKLAGRRSAHARSAGTLGSFPRAPEPQRPRPVFDWSSSMRRDASALDRLGSNSSPASSDRVLR
jgi:hypothetical protein